MKLQTAIFLLIPILISVQGFQLDELEEEPFLEVSDTYLKDQNLSPWFGKEHLSLNAQFTPSKESKIMIWGQTNRVIVMLQVSHQHCKTNKTRNVVFMVDTGSSDTIISPTLHKLLRKDCKLKKKSPEKIPVLINGQPINAKVSRDTFYFDTNIIGMDFLRETQVDFRMKINKTNRDKSQLLFRFPPINDSA